MKKIVSINAAVLLIAVLTLNACIGTVAQQRIPTATTVPAIPATATHTAIPALLLLEEYELLSPEDMRHDLDEFFYQIENVHPNPYVRRSKSDVDLERQRIYNELAEPMTMIDFYRKIDLLVSSLGDQHTLVFLPKQALVTFAKNELILPLDLAFDGEKAWITANYSGNPDIPVGAQVLSINSIHESGRDPPGRGGGPCLDD